jgi:hypothetical protein
MMETAIKVDCFLAVKKKKKDPLMDNPKPRTALLQGEENDVTISNTSDKPPRKEGVIPSFNAKTKYSSYG